MKSLILLYNFAPLYRRGIFTLIDNEWDCQWIFGKNTSDIMGLDISLLNNVTIIENKKLFGNFYIQKGALSICRKDKGDIFMLGEIYNISSWLLLINNKIFGGKRKIYLWSHGWYGRESKAKKWLKKLYFRLADKSFLYGNFAKETAISQGFKYPERLFVIHNSLDYEKQIRLRNSIHSSSIYQDHYNNKHNNLIFIGRLTRSKKLSLLLQCLNYLKEKGIFFNLTIIGGGEDKDNLENLTNELDIQQNVWFYGPCYDETKNAELIYNADLCVSPGNVGLTAIHSMMFGTPVITHDSFPYQGPEFEAIIKGVTGDFFTINDYKSLAEHIESWFNQPEYNREKIRKNCYQEIDLYWTPAFQLNILKENIK